MAKAETKAREAARGSLAKQRAEALEDRLARAMRAAFASGEIAYIGGLEAPLRHGIRTSLCLGGWRWIDADRAAQATVEGALRRIRAVRPSWYEGQPEHTVQGGTLVARTRCIKCHNPLPEGHHKYCGRLCANAHFKQMENLRSGSEETVVHMVTWTL